MLLEIKDVTERKKIEQNQVNDSKLAKVLEIVTSAANTVMSLEQVSHSVLEAISICTGWEAGHAYLLVSDSSYSPKGTVKDAYHFYSTTEFSDFWSEFDKVILDPKSCLPGRVLETAQPQWTSDVSQDPRFQNTSVAQTGVRAAFAFPVLINGKVAAVLEFFSSHANEPDAKLLKLMEGVGHRIGQAILRKRMEDENAALLNKEHEARAKAERDNRTKDFFLATLSHELRTPLTSILLWIQIARDERTSPAKIKQGMEAIEQSAMIQDKLINDLLDTSRIIMGKLSLEKSSVDVAAVIQATIESVKPSAKNKQIQINVDLGPPIGTVSADPLRLQQVFWNLMSNAIKFTPRGKSITVKLERVDKENEAFAEVKIIDTGVGISPEFLPQIFDWFSQVDNSRIREHNGLGLGLAISKNLVELQGGSIQAESPGINMGTTLTVRLPLKTLQNKSWMQSLLARDYGDPAESIQTIKVSLKGIRVLVIDNDESILNAISTILLAIGAEIEVATSAALGLIAFKKFRPDVLLCDIAMPIEDGYSLVRKIRMLSKEEGGEVQAAALTAYVGESDVLNAIDAGFNRHISKPIDIQSLAFSILEMSKATV